MVANEKENNTKSRDIFFITNPNLQKITLQCVWGYKQKTPLMWGTI